MISDEDERGSSEVVIEMLDCPDNGESLELGRAIVSFSSGGASAGISNWSVLSINHLGEYCSKAKGTGISVEDELLLEVRVDQEVVFVHE